MKFKIYGAKLSDMNWLRKSFKGLEIWHLYFV